MSRGKQGLSKFPGICFCLSPDIREITVNRWNLNASIRGLQHCSVGGMLAPWFPTSLSERLSLIVSTPHSFRKKEQMSEGDFSAIDSWTQMLYRRSNAKESVCFRKVPVGSPIYHDYTRMNEETCLAEIWWKWIWVVQPLCLPVWLYKTL